MLAEHDVVGSGSLRAVLGRIAKRLDTAAIYVIDHAHLVFWSVIWAAWVVALLFAAGSGVLLFLGYV